MVGLVACRVLFLRAPEGCVSVSVCPCVHDLCIYRKRGARLREEMQAVLENVIGVCM